VAKRLFEIAKELGLPAKTIVEKCQAEGIPASVIKDHMSSVSVGLEATIRQWFNAPGASELSAYPHVDASTVKPNAEVRGYAQRPKGLLDGLDVHKLPRNAQVAVAARCARRVAFMLSNRMLAKGDKPVTAISIIAVAEQAAMGERVPLDPGLLEKLEQTAVELNGSGQDADNGEESYGCAAYCVYHTLKAAMEESTEIGNSCVTALANAVDAAWWYQLLLEGATTKTVNTDKQDRAVAKIVNSIQYDVGLLQRAMLSIDEGGLGLHSGSQIPSQFFGPLWRDGQPEGWRSQPDQVAEEPPKKIVLQITIPEDVPPEEIESRVVQMIAAMSELHVAHGGSGLIISDRRVWEHSQEPAEVHS
jgi:hypothetical protein